MNRQEIHTLKLLEAVAESHLTSQRKLACRLNISLGLVNSSVRKLTEQGYCKIRQTSGQHATYKLTAKGQAEKSRLTYDYICYSYQFFKEARSKLLHLFLALESQDVKRLALYGVNDFAEIAYLTARDTDMEVVAIVDENRIGDLFFELTIESPVNLVDNAIDRVILTDVGLRSLAFNTFIDQNALHGKVSML